MFNLRLMAVRAERLVYRIAALPTAIAARQGKLDDGAPGVVRRAFAWRYWHPEDAAEWLELAAGLLLWPIVVPLAILWFTARNGAVVRRRRNKSVFAQASEQVRLYFQAGILAPWYYIFSLYRDGDARRARSFLQRSETKWGVFYLLRVQKASPLSDKKKFADRCAASGVRCVPYAVYLDGSATDEIVQLPDRDIFVKPANGRGGKGAERWDRAERLTYSSDGIHCLSERALLERLRSQARRTPLLVQLRLETHPEIADLTSGALSTVRALTCLNEHGEPEVMAAVFRMSIGSNRTVDNIHAGGLACGVSVDQGVLGPASNLGLDARLGWLTSHPDTNAAIAGRKLPMWDEVKALAIQAHRAFDDRPLVGWDIAILADGPIVVEGNGSPDMDLMQRFMERGFCEHRFAELLAFHLRPVVPSRHL
jgi:glutathione synthase/RimK-type ligase-like ATP-grasp enzyme